MDLQRFFKERVRVERAVHGGDICESFYIESDAGRFFLKTNDAVKFPGMLEKEALGLSSLDHFSSLKIPSVINQGEYENQQFLVLEWLDSRLPSPRDWEDFGRGVAKMHRQTNLSFGWDEDNYIGSLPQKNERVAGWPEFYSTQRILPLVQMLGDAGSFSTAEIRDAEKLCNKLDEIFPGELPSLLHGDLWAGNFMFTRHGAALFDPAIYYGHREMDIGMSLLFGGFDNRFYEAYHDENPLEENWKERVIYSQLYPLLVHAVLFGGNYVQRCGAILEKG